MRRLRATAIRALATSFLLFLSPPTALAIDRQYSVQTSTPFGKAVCAFFGHVVKPILGDLLEVTITPDASDPNNGQEARLTLDFHGGGSLQTSAGFEESGCDLFDPSGPSNSIIRLIPPPPPGRKIAVFSAVVDIHAHPNNCLVGDLGKGTLSVVVSPVPPPDWSWTTLAATATRPTQTSGLRSPRRRRGYGAKSSCKDIQITNHGPGDAQNVIVSVTIPKSVFLDSFTPTQGTCDFSTVRKVNCNFGVMPVDGIVSLFLALSPITVGIFTTKYNVDADNTGSVFSKKTTVKTPVVAGTGAMLQVSVACKNNTAGDVTIFPDGSGGTTIFTCPDPLTGRDNYLGAVENYLVPTQVTLTPTPTVGQFKNWINDCKGQPNICVVNVDPASKPVTKAKANFKP